MDPTTSSNRPNKRRRTKAFRRVTEGDDALADGIIVKNSTKGTLAGPVEERIEVPVWCNQPARSPTPELSQIPTPIPVLENQVDGISADSTEFFTHDPPHDETTRRTQAYYIQQFVDRVHPMLKALLAREVLDPNTICSHCANGNIAVWRCRDCTAARILCRGCIRDCHMDCPTHRIEVWTGNYFRRAELWEVGLYILVRHHKDPHLCPQLDFQRNLLDSFQRNNDIREQEMLSDQVPRQDHVDNKSNQRYRGSNISSDDGTMGSENVDEGNNTANQFDEDESFAKFVHGLDRLYKRKYEGEDDNGEVDEIFFEDDILDIGDNMDDMPDLPEEYLPMKTSDTAAPADTGFLHPSPDTPKVDALNNPYVRVVHVNGVHHIGLVYCTCRGRETTHTDLMAAGLIPTSFTIYKTIFTHAVLDDFRLSNLECKASAYQYFQKLRRQTSPMSPDSVPNLYHELRRMSRLWRWMKKLKWGGMAHRPDFTIDPKPGELANFCPACPQPGINIPDNWHMEPERWIYQRSFVADGNFKADHVRQIHTESDIWLSEGSGMTSKRAEYNEFLRTAINRLTKAPCENQFRAIELAMRLSKGCDINGIVAIACARHGCFAPNSVANLPAGEQQKNTDWGLLRALITTNIDSRQRILFIYDIVCQYIVYLRTRIGHHLPAGLIIDAAIGLFHVHGHKDQCFFRYATTFIPGAAIVAGEILESLWSTLNSVTPAMRTATLAHRAEIMDDHMTDSNHKKMLGMATSLVNKYNVAAGTFHCADVYYEKLGEGISKIDRDRWEEEITFAETNRINDPSVMDILGAKQRPREADVSADIFEDDTTHKKDHEWIRLGINIEEKQIEVQDRVRRSGSEPNENDQKDVDRMRQVIISQFALLERLHPDIVPMGSSAGPINDSEREEMFDDLDNGNPFDDETDKDNSTNASRNPDNIDAAVDDVADNVVPPEKRRVSLPSFWTSDKNQYGQVELDLRLDQAARIISGLRDLIAEKSFQFSDVIRVAPRKGVRTRARSTIAKLNNHIAYHCRVYNHCRAALVKLGANDATLTKYRTLQRNDIGSSTALLNPNEPGSTTSHRLSWIWQSSRTTEDETSVGLYEFNRVHWLRARAQMHRWNEELILVGHEMDWTVRYYLYQSGIWRSRRTDSEGQHDSGAAVYATRKVAMWVEMAVSAAAEFRAVNPLYKYPI